MQYSVTSELGQEEKGLRPLTDRLIPGIIVGCRGKRQFLTLIENRFGKTDVRGDSLIRCPEWHR
jgi:hypothetical protein